MTNEEAPLQPEEIIDRFGFQPHPEGGYFVETYRAGESMAADALPARYGGSRDMSTAIYYLLTEGAISAMHRVATDEVYHFYLGDPVEMLLIAPDGTSRIEILGTDIRNGEMPQLAIPRGYWQGSRVRPGGRLALLGATVAPGFDFADFELGTREELAGAYPEHSALIEALTLE